jgi:hypothetical protein
MPCPGVTASPGRFELGILEITKPLVLEGAKVSFKSPTANAWSASFVRHLKSGLERAPLEDPQRLMARVCHAAQAIFDSRSHALSDVPSLTVLGVCALILSAYRELVIQLGSSDKAYEAVERGFVQTYQAFIKNMCKPLLQGVNPSSQTLAEMNFRAWGKRMYKTGHTQVQGAHDVASGSDGSGYFHFFQEHGEPGLAQIVHAADQAWIEAAAAYDHSKIFQRRRTRSSSTDFCPFQFGPAARKRAEAGPDLILELLVNAPAEPVDVDPFEISSGAVRGSSLRERVEERCWALRRDRDRRQVRS